MKRIRQFSTTTAGAAASCNYMSRIRGIAILLLFTNCCYSAIAQEVINVDNNINDEGLLDEELFDIYNNEDYYIYGNNREGDESIELAEPSISEEYDYNTSPDDTKEDEEEERLEKLDMELSDDEIDLIIQQVDAARSIASSGSEGRLSLEEHLTQVLHQKYLDKAMKEEEDSMGGSEYEWNDEELEEWEYGVDTPLISEEQQRQEQEEIGDVKKVVLKGSAEDDRELRKRNGGSRFGHGFKRNKFKTKKKQGQFTKRTDAYKKNKFGNRPVTEQNVRKFRNQCLEPPDMYRTCYSRTVDPSNTVEDCDHVERNSYNLAAILYKRGRPIPPGYPVPYTKPYIVSRTIEARSEGTMHLSLFQDAKDLTCDDMIDIEEATLKYFAENTGNVNSFMPACAFIDENDIDAQITRDSDGEVVVAMAIKVQLMYTVKKAFSNELTTQYTQMRKEKLQAMKKGGMRNRNLQFGGNDGPDMCDVSNHALCCSQTSINASPGRFCKTLGCNFDRCGGRGLGAGRPPNRPPGRPEALPSRPGTLPSRPGDASTLDVTPIRPQRPQGNGGNKPPRPQRPGQGGGGGRPNRPPRPNRPNQNNAQRSLERALEEESICRQPALENKEFTKVIRQMTALTSSQLTRSLLNDTDTTTVAQCSTNWYTVKNGGIPTVTCDEFEQIECRENEDLEFEGDLVPCLEPSASPSESPSQQPSDQPSISSAPSVSSAPTPEPTMSPTIEED